MPFQVVLSSGGPICRSPTLRASLHCIHCESCISGFLCATYFFFLDFLSMFEVPAQLILKIVLVGADVGDLILTHRSHLTFFRPCGPSSSVQLP